MHTLLTQSGQEDENTTGQWMNNTVTWVNSAINIWQRVGPKAVTTFSDITSLFYHTLLSQYLNGKWHQSINLGVINCSRS